MYYVSTMEHAVPNSHRHVAEDLLLIWADFPNEYGTRVARRGSIPERARGVVRAVEGSMAHGLIACRLQDPV